MMKLLIAVMPLYNIVAMMYFKLTFELFGMFKLDNDDENVGDIDVVSCRFVVH